MPSFDDLPALLSLAAAWATEHEAHILREGVPLPTALVTLASAIGIAHPDRVRILSVPAIPVPTHPALRAAAEAAHLITPATSGMSLRYGIFIRSDAVDDHALILHELAHTLQYERLGGIEPFLRAYLSECLTIGYPQAPLEQEAVSIAALASRRPHSIDDATNQPLYFAHIPALIVLLTSAEKHKGAPLSRDEVLDIRESGACIAMPLSAVLELSRSRGYDDLDPEFAWEQWQDVRQQALPPE